MHEIAGTAPGLAVLHIASIGAAAPPGTIVIRCTGKDDDDVLKEHTMQVQLKLAYILTALDETAALMPAAEPMLPMQRTLRCSQ